MRSAVRATVGAVALLLLLIRPEPALHGSAAQSVDARTLLARVADYLQDFESQFLAIVAEERSVQELRTWPLKGRVVADAGQLDNSLPGSAIEPERIRASTRAPIERRQLVSDFLTVQLPNGEWFGFRDIASVDGQPVADRQDRIKRLFLEPSSRTFDQLRRIADEGVRYALGPIKFRFNVPTMSLRYLRATEHWRLDGRRDGQETIAGVPTLVLRIRETRRPTLMRTVARQDVPASGRIWIDANSGRIVRTEMIFEEESARFRVAAQVTYKPDAMTGLWLPAEMRERYDLPNIAAQGLPIVDALTVYSNFRRFTITTDVK